MAEDSIKCNSLVSNLLDRFNKPYVHLAAPTPQIYNSLGINKPSGVSGRRAGLNWVLENHRKVTSENQAKNGVLYFADDDNTYDLELFEDIRKTRRVSGNSSGIPDWWSISWDGKWSYDVLFYSVSRWFYCYGRECPNSPGRKSYWICRWISNKKKISCRHGGFRGIGGLFIDQKAPG